MPGKPVIPSRRHHRSCASVHSEARFSSPATEQASMVEQHTPPARSGGSSPLSAATVASSARARPSANSPREIKAAAFDPIAYVVRSTLPESNADVEGEGGLSERLVALAGQVGEERSDGGQPAVPGVFGLAIQQSLRAVRPRAGDPDRHALQVGDGQIQRRRHRGLVLVGLDRDGVGTLAIVNRVRELAAPPRGAGQQPQTRGVELTLRIRGGQQLIRLRPLVAFERRSSGCQRGIRCFRRLGHRPSGRVAAPDASAAQPQWSCVGRGAP